jgi:hypothetical protein
MIHRDVKRSHIYIICGSLAFSALWFGVSFFTIGAIGGSIQDVSIDASLNEMSEEDFQGMQEGSGAGAFVGPPPDHLVVDIEGTLDLNTPEGRYAESSSATYQLVVGIGENTSVTEIEAVADGPKRVQKTFFIRDDESVAPSENTTVTVSLKHGGETLDSVSREVFVKERNMQSSGFGG